MSTPWLIMLPGYIQSPLTSEAVHVDACEMGLQKRNNFSLLCIGSWSMRTSFISDGANVGDAPQLGIQTAEAN